VRGFADAELCDAPRGRWRDVLSGSERVLGGAQPIAQLIDEFGVALLERSA
jgi:hypothetical protein